MANMPDPKMLKIQLGIELRRLRENAGCTAVEAAAALGGGVPKISKIEGGKQGITADEVRKLAELYEAPDDRRDYLLGIVHQLPRRARRSGAFRDTVPDWFQRFVALESDATQIRLYEVESVTGLLQTEAYARSVIQAWEPAADPRLVDRQVDARMRRQEVLTRSGEPASLHAVLSETALRRTQGGPRIMYEQLRYLLAVSEQANIELRVLPFEAPNRVTVASSFTLLHLAEQGLATVYLEDVLGATYLWEPEEYTRYSVVFERLNSAALPPEESRELVDRVASTFD
ncbi:helix-turn-helix domain-containing protein [Actinopolyspora halophila]|uniref:helix-turn-helix domain-containing protein n=1 Tax=Actinopolyspora halophila TaxID=1850 RepID=UPI000377F876|nr:helix-turn-helix transcriptional regulator [Actinopolyspora halophila]